MKITINLQKTAPDAVEAAIKAAILARFPVAQVEITRTKPPTDFLGMMIDNSVSVALGDTEIEAGLNGWGVSEVVYAIVEEARERKLA
jgi:hypothetical protein